jgi:DNA-binding transcriptional LysR family regulator
MTMLDLDLKSLRLLVAVCDHSNIKLAADQEHIEPSAISKRIAQLESVLGTRLLVRNRRGVEPTAAGLALLEHARNMLFTAERIRTDVAAFNRGIKGQVKLVASASAIAESLLDDIAEFMGDTSNQNIQIDIEERFSRDLVRLVADGGASIGVCWDNVDFQGLERRPYRQDDLALVVHQDHPLATRRSVSFEQTLKYEHVGLPPATAVHTMLGRAAARAGQAIRYRAIVSNFDAELRVVAAGLGISITPRQIAKRYEKLHGIRVIGLSDAFADRRFAVCFRGLEHLQPAALRLVEFLEARAGAEA